MLVLPIKKDVLTDGSRVQHAIKRYVERATGMSWDEVKYGDDVPPESIKTLLSLIEEINLYLPDDWRMTRSKNNFRIFVRIETDAGLRSFVFSGQTYRQANGHTLHVIDTVLKPQHLDNIDREALVAKKDINSLVGKKDRPDAYERLRLDHPELVRPNLYFMKPRFDDFPGPLSARQYERVFRDNSVYEFHRVHPLTKNGIDGTKYHWIKWTIFGEATPVNLPDPGAHGRDFWTVPLIKFEHATRIAEERRRLLNEYDITITGGDQPSGAYEVEYKLLYNGDLRLRQTLFDSAEKLICRAGFSIDSKKNHVQNDTYLDDADFSILAGGGSFRIRQTPDTARVTFKAKHSDCVNPENDYSRLEEEQTITPKDAKALLGGRPPEIIPLKVLKEIFPKCGHLSPRARLETARETLYVKNKHGQDAEVCFDFVRFLDLQGQEVGQDAELEIESKGMPFIEIAKLADSLKKELKLIPSPLSKYERAFKHYPALMNVK